VVGSLTITRYAREGCAYTKGFKLFRGSGIRTQYHIRGSGIRTHGSIVRNNRRNEGVANVAGYAKSSCKQYRLATRAIRETLTTPKED